MCSPGADKPLGGMTFLSRRHGFTCDNIYGYEIVLASGEVVYATADSHPDLWLALKGGANNFGIITRFDVATFPEDLMWQNVVSYNYTDTVLEAQAKAFSHFMDPANFDDAAMMGIFLDFAGGEFSVTDALWYAEKVESPAVYNAFTQISNNGGLSELVNVADAVDNFGARIPSSASR
jgi:FAD/FMN-containing dehydrogenase